MLGRFDLYKLNSGNVSRYISQYLRSTIEHPDQIAYHVLPLIFLLFTYIYIDNVNTSVKMKSGWGFVRATIYVLVKFVYYF